MAPSKVLLLLGLAFLAIVLISSEAASARELAEITHTGDVEEPDHYGGFGHGWKKGHGHGGFGHGGFGKGHGYYGHGGFFGKPGHGGHPGHGAKKETKMASKN